MWSSSEEDIILSTLALPFQAATERFIELYNDEDDEGTSALEGSEEESCQSLDVTADDWLPKKKPCKGK